MDVARRAGFAWSPLVLCSVLMVVLAGCASAPKAAAPKPSTQGDTSYRSVDKDDLQHYQLAMGQISTGATARDTPAPVYPAALLDQRLPPIDVAARLVVDEQGKVSEVRIDGEAQADAHTQLFDGAVRAAAMQWTFEPLRISQWAANANGESHVVSNEARPFSMDYVFRFAWKDGKPVTGAVTPARASNQP